jgi:hypothetical protein
LNIYNNWCIFTIKEYFMSKIIGSCGHELSKNEDDYLISWRSQTRDCEESISYGSICENCEKIYKKENIFLDKKLISKDLD